MASSDDVVLREQIRALKAQQQSMREERSRLEKSIELSEMRSSALKMEANILAALDEVRFQDIEEPVPSASVHDDVVFSRQFIEKNLKLELQILNAELKLALPKLEKAAIKAEDRSNQCREELQQEKKKMESLPIVSQEEVEAKEAELMAAKELLHEQMLKAHKQSWKERGAKMRALTQLRGQVYSLDDEVNLERERAQRIKLLLLEERGKLECLSREHAALKREVEAFHDGKGWQTEAFVGHTSSMHGTIDRAQLLPTLLPWLLTSGSEDGKGDLTAGDVEEALGSLGWQDRDALECDEFIALCDELVRRGAGVDELGR